MKESQNKQILAYMNKGFKITGMEALKMFGCWNLPGRIWDIRFLMNRDVRDELYNTASGKRIKRYFI